MMCIVYVIMISSSMDIEEEIHLMGWDLTPEDLVHIPEHWLSYPEVEVKYHYILAFSYSILFIIGIIGNGLVIWIFSL